MTLVTDAFGWSIRPAGHRIVTDVPMAVKTQHRFFTVHPVTHDDDVRCHVGAAEHCRVALQTIVTDALITRHQTGRQDGLSILTKQIGPGRHHMRPGSVTIGALGLCAMGPGALPQLRLLGMARLAVQRTGVSVSDQFQQSEAPPKDDENGSNNPRSFRE
jgi:hypothetical protein